MAPSTYTRFIRFLQEDLAISAASIAVALRHLEQIHITYDSLAVWVNYTEQLDQIYDWLERLGRK